MYYISCATGWPKPTPTSRCRPSTPLVENDGRSAFGAWSSRAAFLSDVSPADWITRIRDAWKSLVLFGPPEFEEDARVRFVPDPVHRHQRYPTEDFTQAVYAGDEHAIIARTCRALAAATRSSDDCYFAIWAGYSGGVPPLPGGPRMLIPNRDYHLYAGTLSDINEWEEPWTPKTPALLHDPPAFVWPADHAWCLGGIHPCNVLNLDDPYPTLASLTRSQPVSRIAGSSFFLVTGWDVIAEAVARPEDFSSNLTSTMVWKDDGTVEEYPIADLGLRSTCWPPRTTPSQAAPRDGHGHAVVGGPTRPCHRTLRRPHPGPFVG